MSYMENVEKPKETNNFSLKVKNKLRKTRLFGGTYRKQPKENNHFGQPGQTSRPDWASRAGWVVGFLVVVVQMQEVRSAPLPPPPP